MLHRLGFYCHLQTLIRRGQGGCFHRLAEYTGECDYDSFDDAYRGEAESEEAYAQEMVEDNGLLNEVPEPLRATCSAAAKYDVPRQQSRVLPESEQAVYGPGKKRGLRGKAVCTLCVYPSLLICGTLPVIH